MNTLEMLNECRNIIGSFLVGPPLPDNLAYGTNNIPSMVTGEVAKAEDVNTMGSKLASSIARLADGSQAVGKANKFVSSTGTPTHILTATAGTGDVAAVPKTIAEVKNILEIQTPTPSKVIVFDYLDRFNGMGVVAGKRYASGNAYTSKGLLCTKSGKTAMTEPTWGAIGTTQEDGTAEFKILSLEDAVKYVYTPTANVKAIEVTCIGGGGAGYEEGDGFAGGQSAACIRMWIINPITTNIVIGDAGKNLGSAGKTTSFGAYGGAQGGLSRTGNTASPIYGTAKDLSVGIAGLYASSNAYRSTCSYYIASIPPGLSFGCIDILRKMTPGDGVLFPYGSSGDAFKSGNSQGKWGAGAPGAILIKEYI